jgi:transcriptional regulator with XRE-family HTH domain
MRYFCVEKLSKMKETLADRIQTLRKQSGLTQVELADNIGVSKSQFIRY